MGGHQETETEEDTEATEQNSDLGAPTGHEPVQGRRQPLTAAQKHRKRKMERVWRAGRLRGLRSSEQIIRPPPGLVLSVVAGCPPPPPPLAVEIEDEDEEQVNGSQRGEALQERKPETPPPPVNESEADNSCGEPHSLLANMERDNIKACCKPHAAFRMSRTCDISRTRCTSRVAEGSVLWQEASGDVQKGISARFDELVRGLRFAPLQRIIRDHWRFALVVWKFCQLDPDAEKENYLIEALTSSLLHKCQRPSDIRLCIVFMQVRQPHWTPQWMKQQVKNGG